MAEYLKRCEPGQQQMGDRVKRDVAEMLVAIEGMTKAMAVELAPHGTRVNSVAPTFIETPLTRPFFANPDFRADVLRRIPLGRSGEVRDVVGAVLFLASPAARLMTGASLVIDGGWTAQ